jgi:hypothetical protein
MRFVRALENAHFRTARIRNEAIRILLAPNARRDGWATRFRIYLAVDCLRGYGNQVRCPTPNVGGEVA